MAFNKVGTTITQTGTDDNLSLINAITGVTRTFEGLIEVYTMDAGDNLVVDGTLTINPEVNKLVGSSNTLINVSSTGRLNLGEQVTTQNNRFTLGAAVQNTRAQSIWFADNGNSNTIEVAGGSLFADGAIIRSLGHIGCTASASVWLRNLTIYPIDIGTAGAETDPTTGIASNLGAGVFTGVTQGLPANRGYIGVFNTTDLRIDNLTLLNGGEMLFLTAPSGTNTLSGTPNGIFGYNTSGTTVGMFPHLGVPEFNVINTSIANNGNGIDVALQRPRNTTDAQPTRSFTNELGGTTLAFFASEIGVDDRNGGYAQVIRSVNFDINDALTTTGINGGRYFSVDTNNGLRQNRTFGGITRNDTADLTYSGTLVSGSSATDENFVLGIINTAIGGARNTSNDPANTDAINANWRYDLRGITNTQGSDNFDIAFWHPEYNPALFTNTSLTDGTVDTLTLGSSILPDTDFSDTSSTITEVSNLDELYDLIKIKKSSSDTEIIIPTLNTLAVSKTNDNLNIGVRDFTVNTTGNNYDLTTTDINVNVGTGNLSSGTIWRGVETTGNINLNNINLATTLIQAGTLTNLPTDIQSGADITGTYAPTLTSNIAYSFNDNADVSGLTLNFTSANTVTISGKTAAQFAAVPTITGGGTINFIVDLGRTTVTVAPSEPSGMVILRDLDANTNVIISHTFGTETTVLSEANVSTAENNYRIYYKANNSGSIFYSTFIQDVSNNSSIDIGISLISIRHADALTDSAATATGPTASLVIDTGDITSGTVTIGDTGTPSNEAQTLRMFLDLTNNVNYITLLANNEALNDFIRPNKIGSTVDQGILTLDAVAQRQLQAVSPQSGFTIANLSGGVPSVIIFPASTGISIADVIAGVNGSTVATDAANASTNAEQAATNASSALTAATGAETAANSANTTAGESKQASIYTARQQNDVQFRDEYNNATVYELTDI